ncbi:MAG: hypothetical protein H6Q74_668 [Firmicutes bacterium]|nr:hypothetical protein [Bacillota bacterium]
MIIIYHGRRLFWPYLACLLHLKRTTGAKQFSHERVILWQQALMTVGTDEAGNAICCLAHGRYRCLYRRALAGVAQVFGLKVLFLDIDYLLLQEVKYNVFRRFLLVVANYIPWLFGKFAGESAIHLLSSALSTQQEE